MDQVRAGSTSSLSESRSDFVYTPQSSATFSPRIPTSSPHPRPEDAPIPSIESPEQGIFELPDVTTPRSVSSSATYDNVAESLTNMHLLTPDHVSNLPEASSEFTFRCLYNTTPEPRSRSGSNATRNDTPGSATERDTTPTRPRPVVPSSSNPQASGSRARPPTAATHLRASSAPAQPLPPRTSSNPRSYNVNDETAPDEPYFKEEFQRALRRGKLVAQRIASTLETCELTRDRDSQIYSMIQTANELRQFAAPSICTIGIVGDSGVGKSSLINSLLDEGDLALTAGLGAACTSVVTEYRLRTPEHTAKYTIEIDRMTDLEIEEQLEELLWSYRFFHITDLDERSMSADEQKQLESRSKLAWSTLKAAFGSKGQLTEGYLRDTVPGAEARIKEKLKQWTMELEWPEDSHESGWVGSANTVAECKTKTQQFLEGGLWPFIKIIRIFLSSQVLKSGAILADLPGFHDSNHARVKAAEDYMYSCDEIFVVADISRVATNRSVETILQKSLGSNLKNGRPSQGISLVCTKSEDLDVDEIKTMFFADPEDPNSKRVAMLEKKIEELEADDERPGALREMHQTQDELSYRYMRARNGYIEKLVRQSHAKHFNNRPLSVFCVSNKAYKLNRTRVKSHDLSMKGSGVPALRNHCHKIPARAQFRIAHHFLTVSLKTLVQRVQLWLAGGSQETMPNDVTVQRLLETLQHDLKKDSLDSILAFRGTQGSISEDVLLQPMEANIRDWTQDAVDVSSDWRSYHHRPDIGVIERHDIRGQNFNGAPLFAEALQTKIESINYAFADVYELSTRDLAKIKRNATQNHQSSYIFEEMRPTYRACASDSGSGVNARRLARLCQAVGSIRNPVLFTGIHARLRKALSEATKESTSTLRSKVLPILDRISSDIELLRGSEARILARNGDFLERLGQVLGVVTDEMERILEVVARVKNDAETESAV